MLLQGHIWEGADPALHSLGFPAQPELLSFALDHPGCKCEILGGERMCDRFAQLPVCRIPVRRALVQHRRQIRLVRLQAC